MPTTLDAIRVQIGFEDAVGGIFTLGSTAGTGSTLDGGDVLDGLGAAQFSGSYDTVTGDVSDGPSIRIGRDSTLALFEASRCVFTLQKPTLPDYYNPNAVAGQSPIAGLDPGFEPMRPVRVQVKTPGAANFATIWYGFVRSADWNSETRATRVECEDLFLWLSRVRPTFTAAEATSAGVANAATAIGFILSLAGWTNTVYRDLGDGSDLGTALTLDDVLTPGLQHASERPGFLRVDDLVEDPRPARVGEPRLVVEDVLRGPQMMVGRVPRRQRIADHAEQPERPARGPLIDGGRGRREVGARHAVFQRSPSGFSTMVPRRHAP